MLIVGLLVSDFYHNNHYKITKLRVSNGDLFDEGRGYEDE